MDTRNFAFMFYGFLAAWAFLAAYVMILVRREHKLKRELENLKRILEDRERKHK